MDTWRQHLKLLKHSQHLIVIKDMDTWRQHLKLLKHSQHLICYQRHGYMTAAPEIIQT